MTEPRRSVEPLPVYGLDRKQAARFCGLSPNTFESQVELGKLPQPIRFGRRKVWNLRALRKAMDTLAGLPEQDNQNPAEEMALEAIRRGR